MPNPGLRRILTLWQRPELFLGEVIRHSLAPAEDRNTKQTAIGFAMHTVALSFVIDPKSRLGAATAWEHRGSSPKNKKDAKQLMVSVEPRPCPLKHTGLCRMDRVARQTIGRIRADSRAF